MASRPYRARDFEEIYSIEEACFQPPFRFGRAYLKELLRRADAAAWVAEADGRMAGFAIVEWNQEINKVVAYIQTIEVSPEMRGRGFGHELLTHVEDSARDAGAARIWLHVDAENAPAIRLYEAHGYKYEGLDEHFYAPGKTALIFGKEMQQVSSGGA